MKKIILVAIILAGGLFSKAQTCIVNNGTNFSWQMEIYIVQLVPSGLKCPKSAYPHLPPITSGTPIDVPDIGTLTYHASVTVPVGTLYSCSFPWNSSGNCFNTNTTLTSLGAPVPPGWTVARVELTKINPSFPVPSCLPPLTVVVEIPELTGTLNSCSTRELKVIHCSTGDGRFWFQLDHFGNACTQCNDYRPQNGLSGIDINHW